MNVLNSNYTKTKVVSDSLLPHDGSPPGSSVHGILRARTLEWVAMPSPGVFPTWGSYPGLPHCRQILYPLRHQGGPNY